MKTIFISSKNAAISFTFKFDEFTNQLRHFEVDGTMTQKQYEWFAGHFPFTMEKIEEWRTAKRFKVTEQKEAVTFEAFYLKYGNKTGKKKAQNAWDRLSKAKQALAFNYIPNYKYQLKAGTELRCPATYLNSEPWND